MRGKAKLLIKITKREQRLRKTAKNRQREQELEFELDRSWSWVLSLNVERTSKFLQTAD